MRPGVGVCEAVVREESRAGTANKGQRWYMCAISLDCVGVCAQEAFRSQM